MTNTLTYVYKAKISIGRIKMALTKSILILILLVIPVSAKTFSTGYLSGDHEYLAYTNDRVLVFVYLGEPGDHEWFVFGINDTWFLLSDGASVHTLDADYKKHTYNFNHEIYFNFIVEFRVGDVLGFRETLIYFYAWSVGDDIFIGDIVTIKDP